MKKLSIQWRLTLAITILVTATCILLNLFISHSAISSMDTLQIYAFPSDTGLGDTLNFNFNPEELLPPGFDEQVRQAKTIFYIQSAAATVGIILISSFITYFLSARALAPVRELSGRIKKIQAENLSNPLKVPEADDEIAALTRSFNEMLARLDESFTVQQQFSANAAHELRTPLAVIQTNLDVFQKKNTQDIAEYSRMLSMVQEQTNRLSHLVEILLEMSNLQTIQKTDTVSLFELTEEVFCDLNAIAEKKRIKLIQNEGDCTITGSYLLIYRAVYNLIENAIKYNQTGGSVTVQVCCAKNEAVLTVSDTGIGISDENYEKIFNPFFRVDKSRSRAMGGAGLGLVLVKAVAEHHNGQVKVLHSNPSGTTICLTLPVYSESSHPQMQITPTL